MTVRQLEALVRLSEAISRSHLETQVLPRHVKVAVKLLKTSIISVESAEIDLLEFQTENDDNNDENATQPVDGEAATAPPDPASDGQAGGGEGSANKQVKKLVITDEEFYRVTQDLIMRHRQHEETAMQEVVC